ncbi:MAG: hypothetical protein Q4P34_07055 [Tissierellia bacterium]|nr:hypothetical protein [Tissierellia bacterium]
MVSAIGFEGIPIQRQNSKAVIVIFAELLKSGIDFIDTARVYTVSEKLIEDALNIHGRDKFVGYKDYKSDAEVFMRILKSTGNIYRLIL